MCQIIGIISVYLSPCAGYTAEVITKAETRPMLTVVSKAYSQPKESDGEGHHKTNVNGP